jgi:hypothetical protein
MKINNVIHHINRSKDKSRNNSLKKIKYLGVNLTNSVNDLYNENYILLKKEIEGDSRKWRDFPCSWIG